jgi:hypothetical protein
MLNMPRRPRSHVIADIAVSRVVSICNQLGWACEAIQKDYGEDLWIQTTIGDHIDHHRLWFQVKATDDLSKLERKDGKLVFRIDTNHALRWARCLDLVVFVLWDIKNDVGYWVLPKDNMTDVDLMGASLKTAKLVLDKTNQFTPTSANKISWMARIDHYETLLAIERHHLDQTPADREITGYDPKYSEQRINLICYDFLHAIGFLKENSLGDSIGAKLVESMEEYLSNGSDKEDRMVIAAAVTVVILQQIEECGDCGIPGLLLLESMRVAASVISNQLKRAGLTGLKTLLRKLPTKKENRSRAKKRTFTRR